MKLSRDDKAYIRDMRKASQLQAKLYPQLNNLLLGQQPAPSNAKQQNIKSGPRLHYSRQQILSIGSNHLHDAPPADLADVFRASNPENLNNVFLHLETLRK